MKICTTCKIEKPKSEFNKKSSNVDGLERYCKQCHRIRNRNHYLDNPEAYKASARKYKALLIEWFQEYKSTLCCSRCGDVNSWRLAFHHVDPNNKVSGISQMVSNHMSRVLIMEEINKCIVVCQNCHADIHHELETIGSKCYGSTEVS